MRRITAVLIGAGARGRFVYGQYANNHPDQMQIVAVADPDQERRQHAVKEHGIRESYRFDSWEQALFKPKFADVAVISTQDRMHFQPALKALSQGYHVLLEKPMSPYKDEVLQLAEAAKKHDRLLTVCHVLRYTPFWSKVKELLADRAIGDIVSIQLNENVGYFHMAHSFVRGNWRRTDETSPMILQKSCHDMDIIAWLMDQPCLRVSSYGSLLHFRPERAPAGSTERCTGGCPVERECPYSAIKIYSEDETHEWSRFITHDLSPDGINNALHEGPFGRCVYRCDNDVVDHQVVNMEFGNGATASFTMSGFTHDCSRTVQIMGTFGEIRGRMEDEEITLYPFGKQPVSIPVHVHTRGHGGGDELLVQSFLEQVRAGRSADGLTSAQASVQSHLMAFAAEQSRLEGGGSIELSSMIPQMT
ncbi:Gfo/Idh/MocA family protein [Paenibacillus spongiae]|uniref:Gfo/Idh/MocA family oxidoreductase n=1 Tax=Paenibacillus spongiae TaxID=2909671 RepID=A0ABY5SD28_9BACL|nr:Gfo/Idh/MocA family oxidoreductase [Paenibacillus spongiae]UVI30405.1 Gfo/Idh/MocA family oxidoreductase [Paenibacillus spongiae]